MQAEVGLYIFGDASKQRIQATPISHPLIAHGVPIKAPFDSFASILGERVPDLVNAFTLGFPSFRYEDEHCADVAVQYYNIQPADWWRAPETPRDVALLDYWAERLDDIYGQFGRDVDDSR